MNVTPQHTSRTTFVPLSGNPLNLKSTSASDSSNTQWQRSIKISRRPSLKQQNQDIGMDLSLSTPKRQVHWTEPLEIGKTGSPDPSSITTSLSSLNLSFSPLRSIALPSASAASASSSSIPQATDSTFLKLPRKSGSQHSIQDQSSIFDIELSPLPHVTPTSNIIAFTPSQSFTIHPSWGVITQSNLIPLLKARGYKSTPLPPAAESNTPTDLIPTTPSFPEITPAAAHTGYGNRALTFEQKDRGDEVQHVTHASQPLNRSKSEGQPRQAVEGQKTPLKRRRPEAVLDIDGNNIVGDEHHQDHWPRKLARSDGHNVSKHVKESSEVEESMVVDVRTRSETAPMRETGTILYRNAYGNGPWREVKARPENPKRDVSSAVEARTFREASRRARSLSYEEGEINSGEESNNISSREVSGAEKTRVPPKVDGRVRSLSYEEGEINSGEESNNEKMQESPQATRNYKLIQASSRGSSEQQVVYDAGPAFEEDSAIMSTRRALPEMNTTSSRPHKPKRPNAHQRSSKAERKEVLSDDRNNFHAPSSSSDRGNTPPRGPLSRMKVLFWANELNRLSYLLERGKVDLVDCEKLDKVLAAVDENKAHPELTAMLMKETKLAIALRPFRHRSDYSPESRTLARKIFKFWKEEWGAGFDTI